MAEPENKGSLKDFLGKPLFKSDSKAYQYSGLGIQLTFTILIFFFIGYWLDGLLGTKVVFTLILTFVGFGGGFYSFFLTIQKLSKKPGTPDKNGDKLKSKDF